MEDSIVCLTIKAFGDSPWLTVLRTGIVTQALASRKRGNALEPFNAKIPAHLAIPLRQAMTVAAPIAASLFQMDPPLISAPIEAQGSTGPRVLPTPTALPRIARRIGFVECQSVCRCRVPAAKIQTVVQEQSATMAFVPARTTNEIW